MGNYNSNKSLWKNTENDLETVLNSLEISNTSEEEKLNLRTRKLTAKFLGWQQIPPAVFKKEELESLNLQGNQISSISDEIINLINLTELSLEHNRLEEFPVILENLPELKTLTVSYNSFKDINIPLEGFQKLQSIILLGGLESFPKSLSQLPELKNLSLDLRLQEELHDDVFDGFLKLETLVIGKYEFNSYPSSFFQLKSLSKLTLVTKYIPKEMEQLENLQILNIISTYYDPKNECFHFPILNYVLLGSISDCDSFLSLDMDSLVSESLGLFLYKPIVDLSNFVISRKLKVIINNELHILGNDSGLKFKFGKVELRIPKNLKQISKIGSHSIVVDSIGNIWFLEFELFRFIKKHYPIRFKSLPNSRENIISATTETGEVIYSINTDLIPINEDSVKRVYKFLETTIVLLESGTVWIKEAVKNWKLVDIPPITKISLFSTYIVLLDTTNNVWFYQRIFYFFEGISSPRTKITHITELFPTVNVIDNIFCSKTILYLKDANDNFWVCGSNTHKPVSTLGPGYYNTLTKIEYPFVVKNIYPFPKFNIFIDFEWNMWVYGKNPNVQVGVSPINAKHFLSIPPQPKSARF